ncbi:MAG: class I SAM-dependent methyltransferase [Verrucomicrobia bacterium]|nr:class I SAM-dependent methyltransferase [Verrucomicrobiota bacterium]
MFNRVLRVFASPAEHAAISAIIHRHSVNPADIREMTLAGVPLAAARDILDLGCGFGYMTAALLPRIPCDARVVGVDACDENRVPFTELVAASGRQAEFHALILEALLPWANRTFDLVVASYSLYYFPDAIAEIARVLRREGVFLATAHSEDSFGSLYELAGVTPALTPLHALLHRFSAQNGRTQLLPHFHHIQSQFYQNRLRFGAQDGDDLWRFMRFKWPLLRPDTEPPDTPPPDVARRLASARNSPDGFEVEKNDVVFWSRRPRAP